MLLAINAGNTNTTLGLGSYGDWPIRQTHSRNLDPADALEALLGSQPAGTNLPTTTALASVDPAATVAWENAVESRLGFLPILLSGASTIGIEVRYDPPESAGADRLANALAARARLGAPCIAVDFGTATTLDVVSPDGAFIGGAILPGAGTAARALSAGTALLPELQIGGMPTAIGGSTLDGLRSGCVLGHAKAVDGLIQAARVELGAHAPAVATGGLASVFLELCRELQSVEPYLTLDGLALFADCSGGLVA